MSVSSPCRTLAFCPPEEGCKHVCGHWEGRSVSLPLPLPLPFSPYFSVQASGNSFWLLLNILGAQLGNASLYDKFLLSSKCDPQPVNEKSRVKAHCISNWILFLKKQTLDRVGGDDIHSWQPEGGKKSVDWEQAKKRREVRKKMWAEWEKTEPHVWVNLRNIIWW